MRLIHETSPLLCGLVWLSSLLKKKHNKIEEMLIVGRLIATHWPTEKMLIVGRLIATHWPTEKINSLNIICCLCSMKIEH